MQEVQNLEEAAQEAAVKVENAAVRVEKKGEKTSVEEEKFAPALRARVRILPTNDEDVNADEKVNMDAIIEADLVMKVDTEADQDRDEFLMYQKTKNSGRCTKD